MYRNVIKKLTGYSRLSTDTRYFACGGVKTRRGGLFLFSFRVYSTEGSCTVIVLNKNVPGAQLPGVGIHVYTV